HDRHPAAAQHGGKQCVGPALVAKGDVECTLLQQPLEMPPCLPGGPGAAKPYRAQLMHRNARLHEFLTETPLEAEPVFRAHLRTEAPMTRHRHAKRLDAAEDFS